MAKPDRTTTTARSAETAADATTADAKVPARGTESALRAADVAAAPKRMTLEDGTEYLVRPTRDESPVVAMSNRRRQQLEQATRLSEQAPSTSET